MSVSTVIRFYEYNIQVIQIYGKYISQFFKYNDVRSSFKWSPLLLKYGINKKKKVLGGVSSSTETCSSGCSTLINVGHQFIKIKYCCAFSECKEFFIWIRGDFDIHPHLHQSMNARGFLNEVGSK